MIRNSLRIKKCMALLSVPVISTQAWGQADVTKKSKPVFSFEEANLINQFVHQNGDFSAVTGGMGSELLNFYGLNVDLKLGLTFNDVAKHTLKLGFGAETYSSASSDNITPNNTVVSRVIDGKLQTFGPMSSHASSNDERFHGDVMYGFENKATGWMFGVGANTSQEFDYESWGGVFTLGYTTPNGNHTIDFKGTAYFDRLKLIRPIELETNEMLTALAEYWTNGDGEQEDAPRALPAYEDDDDDDNGSGASSATSRASWVKARRTTLTGGISYSAVLTKRMQVSLMADVSYQEGYLATPFHRIYMAGDENNANVGDGVKAAEYYEKLPSSRLKVPVGLRLNYFPFNGMVLRAYLRYSFDTWGIQSWTASLELPIKINKFGSIYPMYRFYNQTAATYFGEAFEHTPDESFYTSDHDLSGFSSHFMGLGIRIGTSKGLVDFYKGYGIKEVELRYGYYIRTIATLDAHSIVLAVKF